MTSLLWSIAGVAIAGKVAKMQHSNVRVAYFDRSQFFFSSNLAMAKPVAFEANRRKRWLD